VRLLIGLAVVVVMGLAVLGIGMGDSPLGSAPPQFRDLPAQAVAAQRERLAGADETVQEGREEFLEEGCGDCHTVATVDGADGELGPRLDVLDDDLDEIVADIMAPATGGPPGYSLKLMPRDYGERMDPEDIRAIATFLKAASG
jgi:mono/diheme cytochrome c family protein